MPFPLSVLRFALSAWVGAATLFVITGILEVRLPELEPATKNQLAAIRFPAYYAVGFTLVGASALCALALRKRSLPRGKGTAIVVLLGVVLLLMVADWFFVFQPLLGLMELPEARDLPEFATYHGWSKYLNFASVGLCLVTAILSLCESGSGQVTTRGKSKEAST